MMSGVQQAVIDHNSTIKSVGGTIASMGLEKSGYSTIGKFITPAVWATDYAVNKNMPDKGDLGIYATGLFGGAAAVASTVVGIFKSVVDDDMNIKLRAVKAAEGAPYNEGIKICYHYASKPPFINAMTIASLGGTSWQHPNGLWVYIVDKNNNPVHDYKPKVAVQIIRPAHPFRMDSNGRLAISNITVRKF
ncbi:hypothetical protein EUZ85_29910 [Hahella sp. KA22]|uniref:hypothetical protein n=1 Tax=Hahella sp. KA22 TaxID=1628392 RepID=UPI000FDE2733|nr:hypothetical protein [Hahella sp. KA22]AZZ94701.1 hypothetical protein ENC22_27325 [Hahella sp. KA22]QAY58074.1 hypothetical protein EUZ85_29910 [Hahella sp. KA22]